MPYVRVDETPFALSPEELLARRGRPLSRRCNAVSLDELDYGDAVFRFQPGGRLEEITQRAAVVHLDRIAVPFGALHAFVRAHDGDAFERAGFVVSPRFGLAFVPGEPPWVTALAAHCVDSWRAL